MIIDDIGAVYNVETQCFEWVRYRFTPNLEGSGREEELDLFHEEISFTLEHAQQWSQRMYQHVTQEYVFHKTTFTNSKRRATITCLEPFSVEQEAYVHLIHKDTNPSMIYKVFCDVMPLPDRMTSRAAFMHRTIDTLYNYPSIGRYAWHELQRKGIEKRRIRLHVTDASETRALMDIIRSE